MRHRLALPILLAALAPAPAAASGPPLFHFDTGSSRPIEPQATILLDWTLDWLKQADAVLIRVTGSADRVGSAAFNRGLSRRRALAVKRALVARGIPSGAIVVDARGESHGLIDTEDGVAERQNRFAMVEFCGSARKNGRKAAPEQTRFILRSRNSPTLPSCRKLLSRAA